MAGIVEMVPRAEYDALEDKASVWPFQVAPQHGTPYAVRLAPLFSPLGAPCSPPPWGSLTAVELATGKILWDVPLGSPRERAPWPIWWLWGDLGSTLRAFDAENGQELWSHHLDHTANATPMSYRLRPDGRQFVVVAAGGHAWSDAGDALVAFALPD
jgi:quinoprotein glucose dehydrogenase